MRKQTRLVITGASGFIGSHLTRYFEKRGLEVHPLSRAAVPLTDSKALSKRLSEIEPTHVIHTAAGVADRTNALDFRFQHENTTVPAITLAKSLPSSVQYSIFLGSCSEYGDGPAPFKEGQALSPLNAYAAAKANAFHACKILALHSKIPMCWGRPSLVFGEGQGTSYLVSFLIDGLLAGKKVPLTAGDQILDFLFIDDFCEMIGTLIEKGPQSPFLELNLAAGEPRKLKDSLIDVQKSVGSGALDFGKLPYRTLPQMNCAVSMKRWFDLFGPIPKTNWEQAIFRTVESYRELSRQKAVGE